MSRFRPAEKLDDLRKRSAVFRYAAILMPSVPAGGINSIITGYFIIKHILYRLDMLNVLPSKIVGPVWHF